MNALDDRKFWMVWNPRRNPPTCRHGTEGSATKEAERLAALYPGQRFYVLAAIKAREVNNMQRIELSEPESELPF